jgi:hypothetical protein
MWDVRSASVAIVMTTIAKVPEVIKKKDVKADYHVFLSIKEVMIVSS